MIDMGCLDPNEVIDISSICMTGHYHLHVDRRHYGINLTEEVLAVVAHIGDIYHTNIKLVFFPHFFAVDTTQCVYLCSVIHTGLCININIMVNIQINCN